MFVDPSKAKLLNEGRRVGSKFFNYGGFPRVSKLNENGVAGQYNDADDKPGDEQVATQPDLSKVSLMTGWGGKPVEFDVANDEGLSGALRHIRGIRTGMDAADSRENIRQSELDADKHNSQFEDQLTKMAKARKLQVKHEGIGGSYLINYGTLK